MTSKVFTPGTVIDSAWLNDVNNGVYVDIPALQAAITPVQLMESAVGYGAVGDGVINDYPAFSAAVTAGVPFFIQNGTYKLSTALNTLDVPILAFGATLNTTPTSYFKSYTDLGQKAIVRNTIRDSSEYSATPSTYTYIKTLTSFNMVHNNGAGYQQSYTSDSGGRTSVPAIYIEGTHTGYGDCPGVSTHYGVSRHPSWASISNSWTGANSAVCYDGEVNAITPNVNVYGAEFHLGDNGYDRVAANGIVIDMARNNANASNSGAYNTVWTGVRLQTSGTYYGDSALSVNGKWNVGIDFAGATLNNLAAMTLKSNDRIYFGASAITPPTSWFSATLPNNYMVFDGTKYVLVTAGIAHFQSSNTSTAIIGGITQTKAGTVVMDLCNASATTLYLGNTGYEIQLNQTVNFTGATVTNSATAGVATALPANPVTYLTIKINGSSYKIPVYNT